MSSLVKISRRFGAAAILAAPLLGATAPVPPAAAPRQDMLDTPARPSARAASAVLIAVAGAGKRLVAVGERGIVLLSDDQGRSWRQAKSVPASVALTGVYFVSEQTGWAVGHSGLVLKSGDGGETWVRQLDGKQAAAIELAAATAAAGAAPSRRLRDAQALVADGADKPFLAVRFFNEQRGLVVGAYGLAFGTADGGQTWTSLADQFDNPKSRHLYHIASAGDAIVVTGEQGTVLRAAGAGQRFAAVPLDYAGTLFGSLAAADDGIVLFGLRGNAFRSGDAGAHWSRLDFGRPATLTAGVRLRDGRLAVVDETGRLMLGDPAGAGFAARALPKMNAATGLVEASDGALVVTTQRGPVRIPPEAFHSEQKP